ncbi:MAG: right-handed parallel beta-helix repeat-containing protein, partial [Abditibacteriales bacterium]|nr:right-handed parallel beta-helix repeat-containing protein [Abditibacteriales bacterium]
MRHYFFIVLVSVLLCMAGFALTLPRASRAAQPLGEPVLEPPTLHCLGVYWVIGGDDNKNARVEVEYRVVGQPWRRGLPLFRVEKGAHQHDRRRGGASLPAQAWLFAGSVVMLTPNTEYELKLTLIDPDGGRAEKRLKARTMAEPVAPPNAPQYHVVPGDGGGTGTRNDPFRGLAAAQAHAQPGDVFLLHAGVYEGTFTVTKSGAPGKPIVWRGAGDGDAIIDGQGKAAKRPGRGISAGDVHDVWFEDLTVRNADYGIVAHRAARLVIRRCHLYRCDYGIAATHNDNDSVHGFFIADNLIEGPSTWPRTKGIENARGIQITGAGHVVCYNRVRGFADGIDTFPSPRCAAIDFHNNEISEMTDDGIEMDYSERNTRCFFNRLTNVFQGISVQPVYGGPVYIFRNALYNVGLETFKMHNSPSGALMFHNTSVKQGMPLILYTGERVRNCVYRNNLFIGTEGNYAYET